MDKERKSGGGRYIASDLYLNNDAAPSGGACRPFTSEGELTAALIYCACAKHFKKTLFGKLQRQRQRKERKTIMTEIFREPCL
jgi:hypothetical protein